MHTTLKWTGERLVPSVLNEIAVEHLSRYAFCLPFVKGKKVLDVACGEGYGSHLLSKEAAEVIGVDIDEKTIRHASQRYSKPNLKFAKGDVVALAFEADYFDVVVSFETIEHIEDHPKMLAELKRVIKPQGLLIISTPNKETYTAASNKQNPFHIKELEKTEFVNLLRNYFTVIQLFNQQNLYGSFLYPDTSMPGKMQEASGSFNGVRPEALLTQPSYFIVLASNRVLPPTHSFFFHSANVYEEQVEALKNTWSYKAGHFLLWPLKWLRNKYSK